MWFTHAFASWADVAITAFIIAVSLLANSFSAGRGYHLRNRIFYKRKIQF
jgi:hypothetical protein